MNHKIAARLAVVTLGLFSTSVVSAATICGFLMTMGLGAGRPHIADRHDTWEISLYKAQISGDDLGYGGPKCACISGILDKKNGVLAEITSITFKSMEICKGDSKLMAAQRELYEQIKD